MSKTWGRPITTGVGSHIRAFPRRGGDVDVGCVPVGQASKLTVSSIAWCSWHLLDVILIGSYLAWTAGFAGCDIRYTSYVIILYSRSVQNYTVQLSHLLRSIMIATPPPSPSPAPLPPSCLYSKTNF